MKPAPAKATDSNTLEEVGRATLQIVHDLKNQLNGLKLYATFLRKRLERADRTAEERETVAKLISGLDRAAREMTMLVKYAQPLEICPQLHVDLGKVVREISREVAGSIQPGNLITCELEPVHGEFDSVALSHALGAITEHAVGSTATKNSVTVRLRKTGSSEGEMAQIEWVCQHGIKPALPTQSSYGTASIRMALATKIIDSHGGRVDFTPDVICAWVPLSQSK